MDSGVYIVLFDLPRDTDIRVGRLGRHRFTRGIYAYVGSAQRNLSHRLARHARPGKPLRWHIDYLAAHATCLGWFEITARRETECQLAAALREQYPCPIPQFGASDCRCGGHLFQVRRGRAVTARLNKTGGERITR